MLPDVSIAQTMSLGRRRTSVAACTDTHAAGSAGLLLGGGGAVGRSVGAMSLSFGSAGCTTMVSLGVMVAAPALPVVGRASRRSASGLAELHAARHTVQAKCVHQECV